MAPKTPTDEAPPEPPPEQAPPAEPPTPPEPPTPAAGEIVVTAHVSTRGLEVGVPTAVADDEEWRALADAGRVTIA